jgi:lipopolysaccharide/colanic/teichoic acid biosynthesis glycosyltransferase
MGYYIRNYKIDELPQLINVFIGDMSLVGPRPEVRRYTDLYTEAQKKVLTVKPGITDYASIEYSNENEILGKAENPEKVYIEEIMPAKLNLNLKYIADQSFLTDIKIILKTIFKILS